MTKSHIQKIFDQLCLRCGLEPWSLEDQNGQWQELCLHLLFTYVPGAKYKARKSFDDHWKIYSGVEAYEAFAHLDNEGNEISKPLMRKQAIFDYAKKTGLSNGEVRASLQWVRKKMKEAGWVFFVWEHKPENAELPIWRFAKRVNPK
jgi:hypothetical protein